MSTLQRDPGDRVRVLDADGQVRERATVPDVPDDELVDTYREMRLARRFDRRAVSHQRQGRMGAYPPVSDQEDAQVGSAHAVAEEDWLSPSYREHAATLHAGLSLEQVLLYWTGHEEGNVRAGLNLFPAAVPIATQIPHATGAAWVSKLRDERVYEGMPRRLGEQLAYLRRLRDDHSDEALLE